MTTIATSLERCTLITMHERAPHTVPQADPLRVSREQCHDRLRGSLRERGWTNAAAGETQDLCCGHDIAGSRWTGNSPH